MLIFNASAAILPFAESDNITLTVNGTINLPISINVTTMRWTFNGQSVPSTFHANALQKHFPHVSQTVELNELGIFNSGIFEAALVIYPATYFIDHLSCPFDYYSSVVKDYGYTYIGVKSIVLSKSSISIQYYGKYTI